MNKEGTKRILWGIVGILGFLSVLFGLGAIVLMFFVPADTGETWGVVLGGTGLTMLLFGLGLAWSGISGRRQTPSPRYYSPWAWLVLGGVSLLLLVLALFVPSDQQTQAIFAPLHHGMIMFPALALFFLVTLVAGRKEAPTLRQTFLAMSGSALSVVVALPAELVGFVFSGLLAGVLAMVFPGGQAELERLFSLVQQWGSMPAVAVDPEELLSLAASPVVLFTAALALAVIVPLIEESSKTLVLGVMGFWEKPSLLRSFTWGAACGLGFAIVEGVSNGAMGLGGGIEWAAAVSTRLLATGMHVLASGLIGLGWGFFWQKRWWMLPLMYVLAVIYHGLWNFDVVLLIGGAGIGTTVAPAGYLLAVLAVGIHLVLLLLLPVGLFGIPLLLKRREI